MVLVEVRGIEPLSKSKPINDLYMLSSIDKVSVQLRSMPKANYTKAKSFTLRVGDS